MLAQCRAEPSDSVFVADGASFNYNRGCPTCSPLAFVSRVTAAPPFANFGSYTIRRVVGSGLAGDFDGNGFLTQSSWDAYTQNGVLSETAWLEFYFLSFIYDDVTNRDEYLTGKTINVYLNDQPKPVYTHPYPLPSPTCIPISTRYMKFARRVPGQNPTPVQNTVAVTFDAPPVFDSVWPPYFMIGTLTIKAMAPVIMVHGYHSGPWWWGPSPSADPGSGTPDACGVDTNYPGDHYDGGFDFVRPFIDAKIPFSCGVQVSQTASVPVGAAALEKQIPAVAAEFGAQHVHLIGHSKGGLWIRAALPWFADNNIGVYSVTTIDTPHHGSALADLLVDAHKRPLLALFDWKKFFALFRRYDPDAEDDLQTKVAEETNVRYPNPVSIQYSVAGVPNWSKYFSVAADADLDSDGHIDAIEEYPYKDFPIEFINNWVQNFKYHYLGSRHLFGFGSTAVAGRAIPSSPVPGQMPFDNNDLVVTVSSSQFDGFNSLAPETGYTGPTPYFAANHKAIGSGDALVGAAQAIISAIQYAESFQ